MPKATKKIEITPAQCRAARSLLDCDQGRLATTAGLGLSTIVDFERGRRAVSEKATAAIRTALETAGVEFIPENGGGAGVRLRKSRPAISDEAAIPETPKGDPYDGSPM